MGRLVTGETMMAKYTLLTNNPVVRDLIENEAKHHLFFIDGPVQAVLSKCEALFLQGNCKLAADPLAGRRARPFPYITLVLQESDKPADADDWNRLADYSALNSRRIEASEACSERLKRDYQALDCSFTKAALKL